MAKIPSPWEAPEVWETLTLLGPQGRVAIPNVTVNVRGGGLEEDSAPIAGENGAERTFLRYRDAEVEVEAVADSKAEFERILAVLNLYRNRRDKKPVILQAAHPNLQLHGVRYVYLFEVESPDFSRESGFVLRFKLREWQSRERRSGAVEKLDGPAPGSLAGSGSGGAGGGKPSAQKAGENRPSTVGLWSVARGVADGSAVANRIVGR